MHLESCKKVYNRDSQRAASLEDTLIRAEGKLPAAGITRIADITQLDRVGIPVFSCIRPTAETGAISIYNGKGATPLAAKVSAMMEGIERFSGEIGNRKCELQTYANLSKNSNVLDPAELVLPPYARIDVPLPWVEGYDIVNKETIFVPAHAVFHPLPMVNPPLFRTNTNGLASGNTKEEALFHALTEVIERDAWSIVEVTRNAGSKITISKLDIVSDLIEKFQEAKIEIHLRDITSDIGIPTIAAAADDILLRDPSLLTIGMGTHTSTKIAVIRALTEVAQSRLTQIHGAREDTTTANIRKKIGYEQIKKLNKYWFEAQDDVNFTNLSTYDSSDFLDDIFHILEYLKRRGMERVIAVDLTRPEIGLPVLRVIVPGLEVYAIDHDRMGQRCRNARDRHISRSKPESR